MTYNDVTPNEKAISGALAAAMHLVFLLLLVFGVSWQQKQPDSAVIVDLWNDLPPIAQPKVDTPAPPELKAEPAPPPPKVEARPAPPPEVKAAPKPDIALKEKLEKEKLQKQKAAEDQRKEREKLDAKQRADERLRLKEEQAKEAKAKQQADEQDRALKALAQQQTAAQDKLRNEYIVRIRNHIRRFIVEPPNLQGNPEVEFDVVLMPGGDVLDVKLRKPSGIPAYDNAVERAIRKAQTLPLPPDPALFKVFRELNLKFKPKDQ